MFKRILILFLICIFLSVVFISAQDVEPRIVKVWSVLETGKNSMFITNIDIAFTELFFTTKTKFESVSLIIVRKNTLSEAYTVPEGIIYQYLDVDKIGIKESDISDTIIKFRVKKSWIAETNANESSISLLRYSNAWEKQITEPDIEDDTYYYYKSETDGFSFFAIVGEKKQFVPVEEPEEVEEEPVPVVAEDTDEPEQKNNISKIIFFIILGIVTIAGVIFINLKNKISFSAKNIDELKDYIARAKSQGETYIGIRTNLINEGWDEKEVDKALTGTKLPDYLKAKMVDYVKAALKKGKTNGDIRNEFINAGWQNEIIDDIFSSLT